MKLVTLLLGLVTFSIVATIMFAAVQNYLTDNDFSGAGKWRELSGDYDKFVNQTAENADSTLRKVSDQTKTGEAGSEDKQIVLLEGAVSGGKLMTNFFFNFDEIVRKVGSDTGTFIDPGIVAVVIAIIMVLIILSVLFFLRGFKAET